MRRSIPAPTLRFLFPPLSLPTLPASLNSCTTKTQRHKIHSHLSISITSLQSKPLSPFSWTIVETYGLTYGLSGSFSFFFLINSFMRYKSHSIKFTYLMDNYNSVDRVLQPSLQFNFRTFSSLPKETTYLLEVTPHFTGNPQSTFWFCYMQNHTIGGLLSLDS